MIDFEAQDNESKKAIIENIKSIFPIEGRENSIEVGNVEIVKQNGPSDIASQKNHILNGRTYSNKVRASLSLKNKEGKIVDKQTLNVMDLPAITERGTYIIGGSEYNVPHQLRLRSGVYSRVQDDGHITAMVNLEKGKNFKVGMDEDERFYVKYDNNHIPLYPILIAMGKSPAEIRKQWGGTMADVNKDVDFEKAIKKIHQKMGFDPTSDMAQMQSQVASEFYDTKLDPNTTRITLGKKFKGVSGDMLLSTSSKLLKIHNGKAEPDERDSLVFKQVKGMNDFIGERFDKKNREITRRIRNKVDRSDNLKTMVSPDIFNKPITSFFHDGDIAIASNPTQTNAVDMISEAQKIILTGAGGITNVETVTDEARSVHPSSMGFIDPIYSPESQKIGLVLHSPIGATKKGDKINAKVYDVKKKKIVDIDPEEMERSVVSFGDEYDFDGEKFKPKGSTVKAYSSDGKMKPVKPKDVDYIITSGTNMFSFSTNLIPFLGSTHPNRGMMGAKMISQSLPLVDPESPMVTTVINGKPLSKSIGDFSVKKAVSDGKVKKITDDKIIITHKDGDREYDYYNNFPLNNKHIIHDNILVKKGDSVKKGQKITEYISTDNGDLAFGKNLRTGYMAIKGWNFEDGIVISEAASNKMKSIHLYNETIDIDNTVVMGINKFKLYAPGTITSDNSSKLDDDGVIVKGSTVNPGDIVFAGLRKSDLTPDEEVIGRFMKNVKPYRKYVREWNHDVVGEVTDVVKTGKYIRINIKTKESAQVGDKLSNRYGGKGIITNILPDAEMPRTKDERPLEIILNPLGVPSRINPSQILETAAGKVAEHDGKFYGVQNFSGENYLEKVKSDLASRGLSDKEEVFDPDTGKKLGNVMVGNQYIMKLDHGVSKKMSVRGPLGDSTYTADLTPTSGGGKGGQSMDALTTYAMLSHGAKENLKEMATDKSTQNDEFWMALESGAPLPAQKQTFAWKKFQNMLMAAGVNMKSENGKLALLPLTDEDVDKMSNGDIAKEDLIRGKNLSPMKGGLFDKEITGGINGSKWATIKLEESMLNPIYIKPTRVILGLTVKEIDGIAAGSIYLDRSGKKVDKDSEGAMTGQKAIGRALSNVKVKEEIGSVGEIIKSARGAKLDSLNRKSRYLSALDKNGMDASVYMTSRIPILPPKFRPIYPLADGNLRVSDINIPYKDIISLNNQIKDAKSIGIPEEEMNKAKSELFDSYKALVGIGSPVTRKEFKGVVEEIAGTRPKTGFFQDKLIRRRQELSGRSTIIPNPNLNLDQVEIPEEILWKMFKPFIVRRLRASGFTVLAAREEVDKKSEAAKRAMREELKNRPVMLNRAPSLHKFSIQSFFAEPTQRKSIAINPFIIKGLNADFDGDTVSVHVPIREKARKEAFKMMPSNNLFNPGDNTLMNKPQQESVVGLNMITAEGKSTSKKYSTDKAAINAYRDGFIGINDMVSVGGSKVNVGRIMLNSQLPSGVKIDSAITKKNLDSILIDVAKKKPGSFSSTIQVMRDVGNDYAYKNGFTIGLDDLSMDFKDRQVILDNAKKSLGSSPSDSKIIDVYTKAIEKMNKSIDKMDDKNSIKLMMNSAGRGGLAQARQIMTGPLLVQDLYENAVPLPITKSYSEGLDSASYFATQAGARRTMMDRALQTSKPGELAKEVINSTASQVVKEKDCGTRRGRVMPVENDNILDRYVANDPSGTLRRNQLIDSNARANLIKKKVKTIEVRSPLTCATVGGLCQKCYGLGDKGVDPNIGDNIGIMSAQAIAEPTTQSVMRSFHSGGAMNQGASVSQGFYRMQEILRMTENLPGKATLSRVSGKINSVKKRPSGGYHVTVDDEKHFIPSFLNLNVKVGQSVQPGDKLSDGVIKPQELAEYKGVEAAQEYLIDSLDKAYRAQGNKINSKIFETVIRPLTTTGIVDDPGDSGFIRGDYSDINRIKQINEDIDRKISYKPTLFGVNTSNLRSENWLSRLNTTRLKDTLMEGASQNWEAELGMANPIGQYAFGVDKVDV